MKEETLNKDMNTAQQLKESLEEKTFEKYLEQVCFEANPAILDDDMPDFFDDWLGSQDGEDYIRLADEYAKSLLTTHTIKLLQHKTPTSRDRTFRGDEEKK